MTSNLHNSLIHGNSSVKMGFKPRLSRQSRIKLLVKQDDERTREPFIFINVRNRVEQRSAFDQVSEFDRGRIEACRDCGLSFREIGSRVGRNQTIVMRICDRWMQEGTTD
ncbi:HTH_38 domain-containing protein [Trichonephila clavipes]|nr:HTH_38 domain-containing protein [Trichonephila clavipes]